MHKGYLQLGVLLAMLSVILGAMGAHALKTTLPTRAMEIFETAVRYQFYHAIALILTGILYKEYHNKNLFEAGRFFIAGTLLFCGSLYLLCYTLSHNISSLNWIGAITPIGGVLFIAGWAAILLGIRNDKRSLS